jgi:hypothetical protein
MALLPLGFGDQMATLSSQTKANDGRWKYHSARRPELTSTVERLENSKFRVWRELVPYSNFLTVPEKIQLKYVFRMINFMIPYSTLWMASPFSLENGIMVGRNWMYLPLSKVLPKEDVPRYQKLMWGIIPILTVIIAFILNIQIIFYRATEPNLIFSNLASNIKNFL